MSAVLTLAFPDEKWSACVLQRDAPQRRRPRTSCSPRGRHEHVVFVLSIECSKYVAIVEGSGDELLAGCRCAACGGSDLRLTGTRVGRRLDIRHRSVMPAVALVRGRAV